MRSYQVIAEGGLDMWDDCKSRSRGIVKVVTDDTQIDLAHLLDNTRTAVKVAVHVPTRNNIETQETGRRYRTQILSIAKHRVRQLLTLN